MFVDGKNIRSTCSNCQSNNKIRKKQARDLLQPESEIQLVEFEELTDELLTAMDQYIDLCDKDKENSNLYEVGFEFEIAIDISQRLLRMLLLKQFKMQMNINGCMYN